MIRQDQLEWRDAELIEALSLVSVREATIEQLTTETLQAQAEVLVHAHSVAVKVSSTDRERELQVIHTPTCSQLLCEVSTPKHEIYSTGRVVQRDAPLCWLR